MSSLSEREIRQDLLLERERETQRPGPSRHLDSQSISTTSGGGFQFHLDRSHFQPPQPLLSLSLSPPKLSVLLHALFSSTMPSLLKSENLSLLLEKIKAFFHFHFQWNLSFLSLSFLSPSLLSFFF